MALNNITIAFPNNDIQKNKLILKNSYQHFGIILLEFLKMPYQRRKTINRIITFDNNTLELLKSKKKGIIITAHYGNWEMIQPALNHNNINLISIAQGQKNQGANKFITWARNKTKTKIIYKGSSIRDMIRALGHSYLGLASDQYAGNSGVQITFFNKNTFTPKGAAIFHLKTGLPILIGFCKLLPDFTYSINFTELKLTDLSKDIETASIYINKLYHDMLENIIKENPEQYFWFHRKWR